MQRLIINKKTKNKLMTMILLFFVVFNPPIIRGISFTPIVLVFSFVYVVVNSRRASSIIYSSMVSRWLRILGIIFVYYLIIVVLSIFMHTEQWGTLIIGYFQTVAYNVAILFVSLFVCISSQKRNYSDDDVFDCYIGAGVIEACLAILAFISHPIKTIMNNLVIRNSTSEMIVGTMSNVWAFRNYGFAATLFDSFGLAMSILALIAFCQAIVRGKLTYYILSAMIGFAACINARTSMVLIAAGIFVILMLSRGTGGNAIFRKVLSVLLLVVAVVFFVRFLNSGSATALWLRKGIDSIKSVFKGEEVTGFFAIILDEIAAPEDPFMLLFGCGLLPHYLGYKSMDMGYFQNLWKFGIIGSVLLYSYYLFPLSRWYKKKDRNSIIAIMIFMVLAIYLFKLNVFGYGIGTTVFMPMIMFELNTIGVSEGKRAITDRITTLREIKA